MLQVLREQLGFKVLRVLLVHKVLREDKEFREVKDLKVPWDLKVLKEELDSKGP